LLASAVAALGSDEAWPAPNHRHVPNHLKHAQVHRSKTAEARHYKHASNHSKRYARLRQSKRRRVARAIVPSVPSPDARPAPSLPPDLAAVKQALELVRQRKPSKATALAMSITDPVGQKLVEWALLRHAESEARFERYASFIRANPDWPSIPLLRQRAEVKLQEPRYRAPARGFLGGEPTG
jgi:soluble lytic murein transglycosylase